MEANNEALKLIAKVIQVLNDYNIAGDESIELSIDYLKQAIDKLAV